jgi:hypothetical protein
VLHHFWITGNHGPGLIDEAWISYFVDGEAAPSISFQPSKMCGQFFPELAPSNQTKLYSAGPLCGRNSNVGGWFNTFPIPFGRSVTVTARPAAEFAAEHGCLHAYVNVRGTENLPVVLPLSGVRHCGSGPLIRSGGPGATTRPPLRPPLFTPSARRFQPASHCVCMRYHLPWQLLAVGPLS